MNIYEIFCINELLISLNCKVLWLKWLFVEKDYMIIRRQVHVPCWNYLYQCSSITGGGIVPPTFFTRKFYDLPRKKGQGGKWRGKEGKFEREEVENWKWKRKGMKTSRGLLFIYFFNYLFIYLFIYFACHFLKPLKFVFRVYQNGQFYQENSYFMLGKNQETWLCPLWKIFLLHHCTDGNTDYGSPLVF